MVEVLFRRNTHHPDGSPRVEALRKAERLFKTSGDFLLEGLGVHALDSEFISFSKFVQNHLDYECQFPEAKTPSVPALLSDLVRMIVADIVEVKVEK